MSAAFWGIQSMGNVSNGESLIDCLRIRSVLDSRWCT